jgi:EamA-like transporter family
MWFWYALAAAFCWAAINVLGSVLLHRYESKISVLGWHLSSVSAVLLLIIALSFSLSTQGLWLLLFSGVTSYVADYYFYIVLKQVEVSLTNLAWAMLSIFLVIVGVLFFQEKLLAIHLFGIGCVIAAVGLLVGRTAILDLRTCGLLVLLALSYLPFYIIQKYTLSTGLAWLSVFFWPMLARECCFLVVPLFSTQLRHHILRTYITRPPLFFFGIVLTIVLFFLASILSVLSFNSGPLFLVGVISNVQPFLVLILAGTVVRLWPKLAPYEKTNVKEVRAKAIAFAIVFIGLALVAVSK